MHAMDIIHIIMHTTRKTRSGSKLVLASTWCTIHNIMNIMYAY